MLSLLAALLLAGPPAARAEAPGKIDAADADGDGTVTGKERRQKRRADRRARRAARGESALSDEELDAADAAESAERGAAASSKASSAAAALKSSLPSADAAGPPPGQPGATAPSPAAGTAAPAAAASATKGASGDPGNPKSPSDFALAARSGYAPAFAAAGLKIAPDGKSVVRLDGKPATPEDYARLQREIASMPAALGRRPDFFSIVSPAHYADLKRGYKEKNDGDKVYKDVGTTEDERDFVHTASCSKLSGDCNASAEKASYKKGDFVAPEDLDNMWEALQKELDGSAESGTPNPGAARSELAREKAMDAARALTDGGQGDEDAIRSATREGKAPEPTTAIKAAAAAARLWKRASALILPGTGGASEEGKAPLWPIGALALAALGAGAFFVRRKG